MFHLNMETGKKAQHAVAIWGKMYHDESISDHLESWRNFREPSFVAQILYLKESRERFKDGTEKAKSRWNIGTQTNKPTVSNSCVIAFGIKGLLSWPCSLLSIDLHDSFSISFPKNPLSARSHRKRITEAPTTTWKFIGRRYVQHFNLSPN